MQNKKCLLRYRLTCSIFVLFKGFLFNCCFSLRKGQMLVFISPFALWREEEGERRGGIPTKKCKNTPQLFEKKGGRGVIFFFPPFLLLAAGSGIDKVLRNQANVTHQPPPQVGNAQTFSVHYYMGEKPFKYCMSHTGTLENTADTLFSNWNRFQMMQHLKPKMLL